MEKEISDIYKEAQEGILQKWNDYMAESKAAIEDYQDAYNEAKKSGDKKLIKKTGMELADEKRKQTLNNNAYKEMLENVTHQMANVNQTALAYANGQIPSIYAKNYAQIGDDLKDFEVIFQGLHGGETIRSIVNEDVIKQRILDGDVTTPFMKTEKFLNIPKDMRWNTKQINSAVLQGILQGDSMDKIADRLLPIVNRNESAAIRNARTIVTGAENAGRLDSYKRLEESGVVMKKVWIATADDRTRESHLVMDGQEVDVDEPFVDGDNNKLDYPGDPSGAPETVYNCRCSMVTDVKGFINPDTGEIDYVDYKDEKGFHQQEIEKELESRNLDTQIKEDEILFIPATSIEEAEAYARENFVVEKTWSGEGNVSYKGLSIDNANEINRTFTNLFKQYDLPKLRNIDMMNFRQKIWKDAKDAPMAYRAMSNGEIYFNPNILKTEKSLADYMKKGQEAFDYCINNIDKFLGQQLELVERYKEAGRQTVSDSSDNSISAMLIHEMGHHLDHQIIMNNKEFIQITKDGINEYGLKLSGYASTTRGEYVAESFCAYQTGLGEIDPKLSEIFDGVKK